jgi:hypothetical protein
LRGGRDLGEDPGDILHGVDALGLEGGALGTVARTCGEVQDVVAPGCQAQAGKADRRPRCVANQCLDALSITGSDINGVVD